MLLQTWESIVIEVMPHTQHDRLSQQQLGLLGFLLSSILRVCTRTRYDNHINNSVNMFL